MDDKSWTIELVLQEGQVQMRLRENERSARLHMKTWQWRLLEAMTGGAVLIGLRDLLRYL